MARGLPRAGARKGWQRGLREYWYEEMKSPERIQYAHEIDRPHDPIRGLAGPTKERFCLKSDICVATSSLVRQWTDRLRNQK